jgi:polar amino acid transport system permease protein
MLHIQTSRRERNSIFSPAMLISTLVVLAIFAALASVTKWHFLAELNFIVLWDYRYAFGRGLLLTLVIAVECVVFGAIIGVAFAALLQLVKAPFTWLILAYVEIWRNTPMLVTLFWIHFALPMATGISTSTVVSGTIAITLQASAYLTDLARTGIQAVPRGQWEASYALGLPSRTQWFSIILPQAFKVIIPPLASIAIGFFKATAILSALSIGEFMSTATRVSEASFHPVETMTVVALVYFVLGSLMSMGTYKLERVLRRER